MWFVIKRLALGAVLIALTSSALLFSDVLGQRAPKREARHRIALFTFVSNMLIEESLDGVRQGLSEGGYSSGANIEIDEYNAQGDMPTAASIAKTILEGDYELVLTATTPCLQAMANANKEGQLTHIFGMVTDPAGAGVGISRENPLDHPKHLAGVGTFEPVKETFQLVREICPEIQIIGSVWNPAEACAEACIKLARESCAELGIELLEANVDNTSLVFEAASSLASRGVQALYVGGDNTVQSSIETVVRAAEQVNIGVFTNTPSNIDNGTSLNLGANFYEVGRITGRLAADVLKGEVDPATVPIENVAPPSLTLNLEDMARFKPAWKPSKDIAASADTVILLNGTRREKSPKPAKAPPAAAKPLDKKWNIHFFDYCDAEHVEENHKGFFPKFKALGMAEDRDYTMQVSNAEGDMPTLSTMVSMAVNDRPDLILLTSTPTLQAVVQKIRDIPVVFSNVVNPLIVGAGKSDTDHLPNVTGIYTPDDVEGMVEVLKECLPDARRIGTLFCPAEPNSVFMKDAFVKVAKDAGLELVPLPSQTSSDIPSSAQALASEPIDAICQIDDNLHDTGFPSLAEAAKRARMPLFAFAAKLAEDKGAALAVACDYEDVGEDLAGLAVRVMHGENPADIPFQPSRKSRLVINLRNAKLYGMTIPEDLIKRADHVIPE